MKKEKTLHEVQEQISELQEEREKCDVKLKQLQNQGKKLERLANEKERKRINHRLIQRGLILERVVENSLMFTNKEMEKLLKIATDTEEYQKAYDEMISKKDMKDEPEEEMIGNTFSHIPVVFHLLYASDNFDEVYLFSH